MEWLNILKKYKKSSGLTYTEISQRTGIPKTTLEKLFSGRTNDPKIGMLTKLAHCLGCTIDELAGSEGDRLTEEERGVILRYRSLDEQGKRAVTAFLRHEAQRAEQARRRETRAVYPMLYYDFPVSAGTGEFMDDTTAEVISLETEPPAGTDYILRIAGNSMEPEFSDGEYVCVSRAGELELGEIGIFICSGSVYMKQYTREGLRSLNPDYALIPASSDIRCLGRVLGKARRAEQ